MRVRSDVVQMRSVMDDDVRLLCQRGVRFRSESQIRLRQVADQRAHAVPIERLSKVAGKISLQPFLGIVAILCANQTVNSGRCAMAQLLEKVGAEKPGGACQQ